MGLALDEPDGSEVPIKVNGIDVFISDKDKGHAEGSLVDYITSPEGEGFVISKGKSSCQTG